MIREIQPLQDIYQSRFFRPVRTGIDFVAKNVLEKTGISLEKEIKILE